PWKQVALGAMFAVAIYIQLYEHFPDPWST
ncbi:unnamed protein product, partial [marine sediment metagenome]